ncbi:MAG: 30S ribosome-binding factor RbfA [Hydrogenophilaceae bacterium]|nr:30S ribosome-binding factor RbfA [Hydrogenophilaceae bacterium]
MPKDFPRSRRVADEIQRELAEIIRLELKDPRIGLITITGVEVTNDLEHARIFITRLTTKPAATSHEDVLHALRRAAGFLRSQLAQRMKLRLVPQLTFAYYESVERGMHLSQLIDQAIAEDARHPRDE